MSREAMKMALDALESWQKEDVYGWGETDNAAVEALRTALAQPEKEWVGLTAYEVQELHLENQHWGNFACAIEAKLKEKNT